MELAGLKIGFALTGSHCTLAEVIPHVEELVREGAEVTGIVSDAVARSDTRFGSASDWCARLEKVTGRPVIRTIVDAEPAGPKKLFNLVVIAPCTGNTLAKLANAITDGPVTMTAKAHLRNGRPVLIGISTNDGLGLNARNLGVLLNSKNVFFIPFRQDNPKEKPNSLVADLSLMLRAIKDALAGRQMQPLLLAPGP